MGAVERILLAQGEAAGRAREQLGNVWGRTLADLSQLPAQIQQQKQRAELLNLEKAREQRLTASAEQEQALAGLRLQDAQRQTQGRAVLAQALKAHTSIDPETGHLNVDQDKVYQTVSAQYPDVAQTFLQQWSTHNDLIAKTQEDTLKAQQGTLKLQAQLVKPVLDLPEDQRGAAYATMMGTSDALFKNHPELSATFRKLPPVYSADVAPALTQLYESSRTQAERVEEALKKSTEFKNRMEGLKAASDTLAGPKQDEWQAFQKAYAGTHGAKTWADLPAAQQQQAVADFAALKRDPNKPEPDPGWSTVTMHDDQSGKDTLVRVNSRTGEVQPVKMPTGVSAGKAAKLNPTQQDQVAAFETLKQEGQKVLQLLKDTGLDQSNDPVGPRWNTIIATKLKMAPTDPRVADIVQRIQFVKANAMRALTGSRMSQYVAQQMEPHLPDSVQTGKQAAHVLTNILEQSDERERNLYQAAGVTLPDFIRPPTTTPSTPTTNPFRR